MEYAVSPGGLLVHVRRDWPCAMCRPDQASERRGLWLCLRCAHHVIVAAEAGVDGARALLGDITDALGLLEGLPRESPVVLN